VYMPFKPISQSCYDALVIAYRDVPGNAARAGRIAGVDRRTAGLAWERGWEAKGWPAIKQILADEKATQVRKAREIHEMELAEREAERDRKRKAEADCARQEEDLVKLARNTTMGAIATLAHPRNAMVKLAEAASDGIIQLAAEWKANPAKVNVDKFLDMAGKYARAINAVDNGARLAIVAERLRTGKLIPDAQGESERIGTLEEALETIELAHVAAERARAGGLVALEGGKSEKKASGK